MFLILVATALASPSFPVAVEAAVGMPCTPSCVLCHETALGGSGTASQEFAFSLMAAGLVAADDTSVAPALAAIDAAASDMDGDGLSDIDELTFGSNPNAGGDDFCAVPIPQYGCFAGESTAYMGGFLAFLAWRGRRLSPRPAG